MIFGQLSGVSPNGSGSSMNIVFKYILRFLQRRCDHKHLRADLAEGCFAWAHKTDDGASVKWCPVCGAVQIGDCGFLRVPQPTWEK